MKIYQIIGSVVMVSCLAIGCKPKADSSTTATTTTSKMQLPALSAQDNKRIIDREISTWEFGKTRNLPALRQILADDYIGVFGKNIMGPNDVLRTFEKSTVRSYRLYNIKVKPVAENVAVIYYNLMQDIVDENGSPWIPNVASSAVYVKRNNNWYSTFYHETPLDQ
jgi:hypothetical protein